MPKTRFMIQLDEEDSAWVDAQCAAADRSRPYVISKAIRLAKANGLDLSSGQARETAKAFRGRK